MYTYIYVTNKQSSKYKYASESFDIVKSFVGTLGYILENFWPIHIPVSQKAHQDFFFFFFCITWVCQAIQGKGISNAWAPFLFFIWADIKGRFG